MNLSRNMSALALLLCSTTPVFSTNYILLNEYVKAGVNEATGTLGSGGGTRPGLQYDSTGTGTFPADSDQGDYLTPGSPFEGFTVKIEQFGADGVEGGTDDTSTSYTNNNTGSAAISGGAWVSTPDASSAIWSATSTDFTIQNSYSLPSGQQYIDIDTEITALSNIDRLSFGRFIDPDAMPMAGDTSATDNVLGYSGIPDTNVVFSEATVSRYALGLYSSATNVGAGISSSWSTDPSVYYSGGSYSLGTGDHTIGLGFVSTGLSLGDIVNYQYAYIFGPSAFDAATFAVDGGAGGGVAGVVPGGGTLVDVGSATDAASGPTIVASASSSVTNHTATETSTTQTIARSTLTSTWDVYSDGSLGTPVVVATDPGSFTGSITQVESGLAVLRDAHKTRSNTMGASFGKSTSDIGDISMRTLSLSVPTDNGMTISGRFDRLVIEETDLDATMKTFGLGVTFSNVSLSLDKSETEIGYSREIGTFANDGSTTVKDTNLTAKVTLEDILHKKADVDSVEEKKEPAVTLHPIVGLSIGRTTTDGYTETGSVQSARVVDSLSDGYVSAILGARLETGVFGVEAIRYTEGVNVISVGVDYDISKSGSVYVKASRTFSDESTGSSIDAGVSYKF